MGRSFLDKFFVEWPLLQNNHSEAKNYFEGSRLRNSPSRWLLFQEHRKICDSFFKPAFKVFEPIEIASAAAVSEFLISRLPELKIIGRS